LKGSSTSRHEEVGTKETDAMTIKVWTLDGTCFVLLATVALATGCDANHALGDVDGGPYVAPAAPGATAGATGAAGGGAGSAAGGSAPGAPGASGPKADPATLGPSQSWTGYEEPGKFNSGSDAIVLTFAVDAAGVVAGTVVFGMGTPPPPATDPDAYYPPDLLKGPFGIQRLPLGAALGYVAEGYSYTFDGGSFDGHRLRFEVNMAQVWASWCALQTQGADGSSSCLPNWPGMGGPSSVNSPVEDCEIQNPQTMKWYSVSCAKMALCYGAGPCTCTPASCTVVASGLGTSFDLFIDGTTATGSWNNGNVHFVEN
jgi:hypothetical protein